MAEQKKARRGFAAMSPEKQREISSKGGLAVHASGRGRKWDEESGAEAGKKGAAARNAVRQAQRDELSV